jgi:hypothetical protein
MEGRVTEAVERVERVEGWSDLVLWQQRDAVSSLEGW